MIIDFMPFMCDSPKRNKYEFECNKSLLLKKGLSQ